MSINLKYRPLVFNDVVNQKHIVDILKTQIQKNDIVNNYLFFGPRGTGKTTCARILARAINCTSPKDGSPCNECEGCKSILNNKNIDFVEIDAASHTQVDNIREEIIEKSIYPPSMLKKKIYIIDEVHMLSKAAFNALLKIMEEPPEYLVFILATTEINKVPETIVSRSLVFNFKKLTQQDIVDRLEFLANQEKLKYDKESLDLIAKVSDGAMRDAVKYLEQVSVIGDINQESVSKFLGVAPDKLILEFINLLKQSDINKIFDFLDTLKSGGIDLYVFCKQFLMYIDENFMEDIDFYSSMADLFKKIILSIRNYPYPIVVFKTEIYKYLNSTPASNQVSQPTTTNKVVQSKNKKQDSDEEKFETKQNQSSNFSSKDLINEVIKANEKTILNKALENYVTVSNQTDQEVELIVVNMMQYNILKKEIEHLEKLFCDVKNCQIKLNIKYVSKEDFLEMDL